jgi:3-dehydroquinate dehydratase type I
MVPDPDRVLEAMTRARELGADLLEWRLDVTRDPDIESTLRQAPLPVIATVRSVQQGGRFRGTPAEQLHLLLRAAEGGSEYLDWEFAPGVSLPAELSHRRAQVIISYHNLDETPPEADLAALLTHMGATGAGVTKVVCRARIPEDNLTVLSLIARGRREGRNVVAFCLGRVGRISRVACPLAGGAFSYAALEPGAEAASGQLSIVEMRRLLDVLT